MSLTDDSRSGAPTPSADATGASQVPPASAADYALDPIYYSRRWWILVILSMSLTIIIVGNTALNVAIPTLFKQLHASETQLQWIVDAYSLVFAGCLLTAGALGDRFGRKGALAIGLVIFGLSSAGGAVATSANQLIISRAFMGMGAALVMPGTLSILAHVFPARERPKAIAIWSGMSMAGGALGPLISGFLLKHFWWGSVFLVNVPIVVVALIAGQYLLPRSKDPHETPLDPAGALLSMAGLGALLYGIIQAPESGWTDPTILGSFVIAAVILGVWAFWQFKARHPMLDLRLFKNPRLASSAGNVSLVYFAMFGTFFLISPYFQLVKGWDPFSSAWRQIPMMFVMVLIAPQSARIVERFGPRLVVSTGLTIVGFGLFGQLLFQVNTPYWEMIGVMALMAGGMAVVVAPCTGLIMTSIPMNKAGVGSAINDTTRELGGALGVAVLGSVLASRYASKLHSTLVGLPSDSAAAAKKSLGGALNVSSTLDANAGKQLVSTAKHAYVSGLHGAVVLGALACWIAAGLVARTLPRKSAHLEHLLSHEMHDIAPPVAVAGADVVAPLALTDDADASIGAASATGNGRGSTSDPGNVAEAAGKPGAPAPMRSAQRS